MTAYYNEIDPYAAQWLRNLIEAGHIADGVVDERSITEIEPDELERFTQCHFFAGIGVWSYALRRAGWRDTRPVWTGSCPCQPFSVAGKRKGTDDERHLWPAWYELVKHCQPAVIFGEQVASSEVVGKADGSGEDVWLDVVSSDMERAHYAFASFDLPAAGFGAPHIRQRVYFAAEHLANTDDKRSQGRSECRDGPDKWTTGEGCVADRMGDASIEPSKRGAGSIPGAEVQSSGEGCADGRHNNGHTDASEVIGLADKHGDGRDKRREGVATTWNDGALRDGAIVRPSSCNGFWSDPDWIGCRDNKLRPVESGTFPLANGATQRVGRLRAYGNAICAEVATGFISAYMGND